MKKQTKVLVAATLLTLGASFSALAASKGTWVLNDEGWQYVDKEGEYVEEEWCKSNGIDYWVNEEGVLGANEWVSDGEYSYYVGSDGSKTINEWKYIFGEDDEDADEESWFWFDAKGRMAKKEVKTINGSKYYFDENGKMLTGWIDKTDFIELDGDAVDVSDVVYCGEDGARGAGWINVFPWYKNSDDCYEGDDEEWFYLSSGTPYAQAKKNIDGYSYIFGNQGEMLTGWVEKNYAGVYTGSNAIDSSADAEVYFCDEDYGYVKKNGWRYLECAEDNDDEFWYYFDKLGRVFTATATNAISVDSLDFDNGENAGNGLGEATADIVANTKKIDGVQYYFNTKGEMIDGLIRVGNDIMYLKDGARQTGKVTLTDDNENDYTFYFADKTEEDYDKYVAVNGNMDGYCYKNGQLMKSEEKDVYEMVTLDNGAQFIVDYRGKIQHKAGKVYEGTTSATGYTFNESANGSLEDSVAGTYTAQ